jgi:hypothetical protein
MGDDVIPAETGPPISEDIQQRGIDYLQGLLASGKVDLDRFQEGLDALLGAQTQAELASVVRSCRRRSNSPRPRGGAMSRSRSLPPWPRFVSRATGR